MSDYQGIVCPLTNVRTHPNADRLKLATVMGHQIVGGLDMVNGTLGVFFPDDGMLSEDFLVENELFNQAAIEALYPQADLSAWNFGYFSANRRVRAQAFRGQKSEGFWCELEMLRFTGYDVTKLTEGDTFDSLNGVGICEKYFTQATLRAIKNGQQKKPVKAVFPKHLDTKQFRYYANSIRDGAVIYISEKLHGTSGRFGNVLETRVPTSWLRRTLDRVACWFTGATMDYREWTHLNGSRNVILEQQGSDEERSGFYGSNAFRYELTADLSLHKGEVVYFEIVGYVNDEQPIMQRQTVTDKAMVKEFGPVMTYAYGCAPGEHKLFVYRITRLNEDGIETDLSWVQVMQRCRELDLATVPQLLPSFIYEDDMRADLALAIEGLVDGPSLLDSRHLCEGVVLRIESDQGTLFLKEKSFQFKVLEGIVKDSDRVDIEEAA